MNKLRTHSTHGEELDTRDRETWNVNTWLVALFAAIHIVLLIVSSLYAESDWSWLPWLAPDRATLIQFGGLHLPSLFESTELWRVLTCAFLHGSWLHLLFNGLGMLSVGNAGEALWGPRAHLLIWTLSALGSSLLSMAVVESSLMIGASGGLFGLAVALMLETQFPRPGQNFRPGATRSLRLQIIGWLILGFAANLWTDVPISAWGHLGGAVSGAIAWWMLRATKFRSLAYVLFMVWIAALLTGWHGRWRPEKLRETLGMDAVLNENCEEGTRWLEPLLAASKDPVLLNGWAYCETLRGGDIERALAIAQQALELSPEDPNIMDTLGWAYCSLGQGQQGVHWIRKALSTGGPDPVLQAHLAACSLLPGGAAPTSPPPPAVRPSHSSGSVGTR